MLETKRPTSHLFQAPRTSGPLPFKTHSTFTVTQQLLFQVDINVIHCSLSSLLSLKAARSNQQPAHRPQISKVGIYCTVPARAKPSACYHTRTHKRPAFPGMQIRNAIPSHSDPHKHQSKAKQSATHLNYKDTIQKVKFLLPISFHVD
jgi:hypothetical protein